MPVDAKLVRANAAPLEERILDILRKDPSKAYDAFEIGASVAGVEQPVYVFTCLLEAGASQEKSSVTHKRTTDALGRLLKDGRLESGLHRGATYYMLPERSR